MGSEMCIRDSLEGVFTITIIMNPSNDESHNRLELEPILPDLKAYRRVDIDDQWSAFMNQIISSQN